MNNEIQGDYFMNIIFKSNLYGTYFILFDEINALRANFEEKYNCIENQYLSILKGKIAGFINIILFPNHKITLGN